LHPSSSFSKSNPALPPSRSRERNSESTEKFWVSPSSVGPNAGIRAWAVFKSWLIPPSQVDVLFLSGHVPLRWPNPQGYAVWPVSVFALLPRRTRRRRWTRQHTLRGLLGGESSAKDRSEQLVARRRGGVALRSEKGPLGYGPTPAFWAYLSLLSPYVYRHTLLESLSTTQYSLGGRG
jgi:hypothetical protein